MKTSAQKAVMILCALLLCTGCATIRPKADQPHPPDKEIQDRDVQKKSQLAEFLIPQMEEKKPTPKSEETFSIAVQETNIKDVLMVLARDSRYNIVVDPDIETRVTVDLKKVTMTDALESILGLLKLEYKLQGNTIYVLPRQMQTRVFTLNYITGSRTGETMLSVSSGGQSDGQSGSSGSAYGTIKSESKAALWEEIREGLNAILFGGESSDSSQKNGERLVINQLSGTILVTGYPEKLMEVSDFLETVEGSIQRQVMITAKILEVTLSDSFKMGIDWAGIPNLRGSFVGDLATGLAATQPLPASVVQQLSPDQGLFQIGATKGDISFLLDVIATQGEIRVLFSPRISTLNNQKAIIKTAREDSFFTLNREINSEGGVLQENFSVERSDYTIGVVLDVTPQISRNGAITMIIHPSITEFVAEKTFPPGATGKDILANAPILDVREVDTIVRVQSGETIVIGGLMKEKKVNRVTSVPVLGNLPWVGWLFKRTETETENIELVILITPEVIVGQSPSKVPFTQLNPSHP